MSYIKYYLLTILKTSGEERGRDDHDDPCVHGYIYIYIQISLSLYIYIYIYVLHLFICLFIYLSIYTRRNAVAMIMAIRLQNHFAIRSICRLFNYPVYFQDFVSGKLRIYMNICIYIYIYICVFLSLSLYIYIYTSLSL